MQATLISIGDELLIGQVINTNAAWMAGELNQIGVKVKEVLTISDEAPHIKAALDQALATSQIILLTGGLGPTKDDITKKTLAEYFDSGMVINEEILADLKHYLTKRGRPILDSVLALAEMPEKCEVIRNLKGTAAAMWFEKEGSVVISMPGVPYEMKDFMDRVVMPRLKVQFNTPFIYHKTIICAGLGESIIAEKIAVISEKLPPHIKIAFLPNLAIVRLRLSGQGGTETQLKAEVEGYAQEIWDLLHPKYAIGWHQDKLEEVIGRLLLEKGKTVSTAESCTGGLIGSKITSIPGSSAYYKGGLVVYSNELKMKLLGVKAATLETFGAVSEETVREMAQGTIDRLDTDYAIAISGIAGPGGGSPEKPVGTVWIAVGDKDTIITKQHNFPFGRKMVTNISALMALVELRRFILS